MDFRRASGFLYSAISPCKNPSNLSRCFWIPVERDFAKQESTNAKNIHIDSSIAMFCLTRIQIRNDKLLGFLHSKVSYTGIRKCDEHPLGFLHGEISLHKLPEITCKSVYGHMTLKRTTLMTMYMAMLSLKNQYHRHTHVTKPIRRPAGRI